MFHIPLIISSAFDPASTVAPLAPTTPYHSFVIRYFELQPAYSEGTSVPAIGRAIALGPAVTRGGGIGGGLSFEGEPNLPACASCIICCSFCSALAVIVSLASTACVSCSGAVGSGGTGGVPPFTLYANNRASTTPAIPNAVARCSRRLREVLYVVFCLTFLIHASQQLTSPGNPGAIAKPPAEYGARTQNYHLNEEPKYIRACSQRGGCLRREDEI